MIGDKRKDLTMVNTGFDSELWLTVDGSYKYYPKVIVG